MIQSNMVTGTGETSDFSVLSPKLPSISELSQYTINPNLLGECPILPSISPHTNLPKKRGAPIKRKNELINTYKLKNTNGKTFKFSFVPQILVSHLHHLFNMKNKSRYQRDRWVRSYTPQGVAMQKEIFNVVGEDCQILHFKRTVSIRELKDWLKGDTYRQEYSREFASRIRMNVFRLFCILKNIDLRMHFGLDFSIQEKSERSYLLFKRYICFDIWEELGLPALTEQEIHEVISMAILKHS